MNDLWKGIFSGRTALKYFAVACTFYLVLGGVAQAQSPCGTPADPGWRMKNNPSLDDQRAITDLLSAYAWSIDDRRPSDFAALFQEPESYYEICSTGGSLFVLTLSTNLLSGMQAITKELEDDRIQTRHFVTNTLFDVIDEKTINTKSTVLVTVQLAILEKPQLDYTADARATVVKDKDGNWTFRSLTIHADTGAAVTKKR